VFNVFIELVIELFELSNEFMLEYIEFFELSNELILLFKFGIDVKIILFNELFKFNVFCFISFKSELPHLNILKYQFHLLIKYCLNSFN